MFAAADGMRLVYPVPKAAEPVLPAKGARWPLEWDGKPDGVMTVTDPDTGVVRSFGTPLPTDTFGVFRLPVDSWQDRNGARIDIERSGRAYPSACATAAATTSPWTRVVAASWPCASWTKRRPPTRHGMCRRMPERW